MVMSLLTRPKKTVATITVATDGSGDTTDIQTGINMLPATGGCIYIREGVYTITATIIIPNNNIALIGCGRCTQINIIIADEHAILATNVDGIGIENMRITGVSGFAGVDHFAILFDNVNQSTISNIWIDNCTDANAAAIGISNSTLNLIISCKLDTNRNNIVIGGSSAITISDNIIYNATNYGINISTSSLNVIKGNQVVGSLGNSIRLEASNRNIIISNVIEEGGLNGIFLDAAESNVITNNMIESIQRDGVNLDFLSHRNIISNNEFYQINLDDGAFWGIQVASDGNNICENIFNNCHLDQAIELTEGAVGNIVSSNRFLISDDITDLGDNNQIFNNLFT